MSRTRLTLLTIFFLLFAGSRTTFAQEPPLDSLGGKIVHVYLPSDDIDILLLRNWNVSMTTTGKYWYTVTLRGDIYNSNQGFFFTNNRSDLFITKEGLSTMEKTRFYLADFQGKQEMWIIIDPSGPITAKPVILLEPPKIVNILNPWETTGPRLVLPYGKKSMVTVPGRCGWFMAFLLDPRDIKLHVEEINGTGTYGSTGRATPVVDYDIAAEFAAKGSPSAFGSNLWLDTELNAWTPAHPNKDAYCQYLLAAKARDFSAGHPDFDFAAIKGDHSAPGMVNTAIQVVGGERLPARSAVTGEINGLNIFNDFESWWRTDETNATIANRSYETCVDIPMDKAGDGSWEYDSYKNPAHGFWPLDDFANPNNVMNVASCYNNPSQPSQWTTGGIKHNMNFCLESHATFIYRKGQTFEFRGDDDVWLFIDGKLAMDLGGIHIPATDTVHLDSLGLVEGKNYNWDFFYCDRQPCGSALKIKTSIHFNQKRILDTIEDPANPGSVRIVKREDGTGSCSSLGDSLPEVPAANLVYKLWNASGVELDTLEVGTHYGGGIVISGSSILVDTSKITTLTPGNYRIVAYEETRPNVRVEVPFVVQSRTTGLARIREKAKRAEAGRYHDALGRSGNPSRQGTLRRFWRLFNP